MLLTYLVNESNQYYADLDIQFSSTKDIDLFNDTKTLTRRFGDKRAKLIRRRLDELRAADTLEDMRGIGRCHELSGDKKYILSVDLDGPYRLLFKPGHHPIPQKPDGGLDWPEVTLIMILNVEDTHG